MTKVINLTEEENNYLMTNCEEVAKQLNNFFGNAVKNLSIPNYENQASLAEHIDDPTPLLNGEAIVKWRNQPSILAIASEYKNRANFSFNFVSKEDVLARIKALDGSKAIQENDIPVKIVTANSNFFA